MCWTQFSWDIFSSCRVFWVRVEESADDHNLTYFTGTVQRWTTTELQRFRSHCSYIYSIPVNTPVFPVFPMHHAAQTIRPRDMKLSQMVGLSLGKTYQYEPDWPTGGATATKSTKLLITPRPLDLQSNFDLDSKTFLLCRIWSKIYFCELVLGFSPNQNHTRSI